MVHRSLISLLAAITFFSCSFGQQTADIEELKQQILSLETEVNTVNLNLQQSQSKFQQGILIATLGYTTTIVGGMMLGRSNDQTGQALLIAGGVTGVIGTYKMVDAFKYLTGDRKRKNSP